MAVAEVFFETARRVPSRIAFQIKERDGYRRLLYRDAAERVRRTAAALRREGIAAGDRVAVIGENSPEWCLAYLAIVAVGATAVPLDVQLPPDEVRLLLEASGSRLVCASGIWRARLAGLVDQLPARPRLLDLAAMVPAPERGAPEGAGGRAGDELPSVDPATPASLLYTSGTTAVPKGVLLSHTNLLSNARGIVASGLAGPTDNFLAVLPLHHAYPFMAAFLLPITCGATVTCLQSLKGPDLLACLRDTRITVLVGVPQLYAMIQRGILDQITRRPAPIRAAVRGLLALLVALRQATGLNLSRLVFARVHRRFGGTLRICTSGGARLDPEVARLLMALGFTILEGYGLTETAPVVTFNPLRRPRLGSVGLPIPGVEVKIADADQEVLVRGPNVMIGYDRRPDETSRVIRDGWFHSGDQGRLDAQGYLSLTGRIKEIIVMGGGKKVYPDEVEAHYLKSRFIKELCLIGLDDDAGTGEHLYAVIVPDLDALRAEGLPAPAETIRWEIKNLSRALPSFRRVMGFEVVKDPLPRTRLGKVQRHLVKAGVLERRRGVAQREQPEASSVTPEDARLLAQEPARRVLALITQIAAASQPRAPVGLDDHLELDLGLDSLKRVELITAIEQAFDVALPEMAEAEAMTVRDMVAVVLQSVALGGATPEPAEGQATLPLFKIALDAAGDAEHGRSPFASPWHHRCLARLVLPLIRTILRLVFQFRVEGPAPPPGPVILTPNHQSYLDGLIMACAVPPAEFARLYFLGDAKIFKGRWALWLARLTHVVVVNTEGAPIKTLRDSAAVLRRGHRLCFFPEGGISLDGNLLPFKHGVAILMKELGVPVVPVLLRGTADVLPQGAWRPRRRPITVRFGEPVLAADLRGSAAAAGTQAPPGVPAPPDVKNEYETLAERLRDRLRRLAGAE